ncbi:MAG TPA: hypothetical protein VFX97_06700 [Pyrinomonadaceae bacterium]|nr:hypothetical protein [Pyrinomonadaceae bacterium]
MAESASQPSKQQLQKQMEKTRQSVSETVGEIKETVNEQIAVAKQTVTGVLNYREEFQKEPLVWSLGALSAGFALGYTMGYAHRETKGARKKSEVAAFANSMVEELSVVGNSLVMPALNARIKELFGFDFGDALESIGKVNKSKPKRQKARKTIGRPKRKALPAKSRK